MPANRCPQGHEIRSAADRDKFGYCRKCKAERERRRRVGNSAALMVVRAFEAAGVRFEHDGVPVAPAEVAKALAELYEAGALPELP
ncbi:hypothetical protein MSP7336_01472 [Mycobacterium shimoidei]|uniref:Uncharacterized protein n=1 Tax=Mycobacterium shimoidei TaxID=29313 RepID=A0A375YWJ0_MYCSH|nr:hypothetical protein [Mycobacterium shimoidei]SRX93236.1 hypothetical protein MSP7336_01472 [Mycobacterium shimoidei]